MMSSCILGFEAAQPPTRAYFIHPLFTVCWRITWRITLSISEANNSGLQTQQCDWTSGWKSLQWKIEHRMNGDLNFSENSEEEDQCIQRAVYIKPESG